MHALQAAVGAHMLASCYYIQNLSVMPMLVYLDVQKAELLSCDLTNTWGDGYVYVLQKLVATRETKQRTRRLCTTTKKKWTRQKVGTTQMRS